MSFGSAIFIFTLLFLLFLFLQCFSFCFHVFICDCVVMNQNFFSVFVWEAQSPNPLWVSGFSLFHLLLNSSLKCETLKDKKEKKKKGLFHFRFARHFIAGPLFFFIVCVFLYHRNTNRQNLSELNLGMSTPFDNLCALLSHLSKHQHYTTVCFTSVRLFTLSSTLIGQRFTIRQTSPQKKSPFGLYEKNSLLNTSTHYL